MSTDFAALRLKAGGNRELLDAILQQECKEKTRVKLAETLERLPDFRFPSLAVAEMATSDAVASVHASMIGEGERVCDMTFGLGIDAYAMARHAASVMAFDIGLPNVEAGLRNAAALGLTNIRIEHADSVEWLKNHPDVMFDTIFIDPARRDGSGRHFRIADCSPDLTASADFLRSRCKRLIVKLSPMLDISAALADLGVKSEDAADVTVIGFHNECKELVISMPGVLSTGQTTGIVTAITLDKPSFSFRPGLPPLNSPRYAVPAAGQYLLEPYPAVMKAGATAWLYDFDGVYGLHPNTHLFVADSVPDGFPAKRFEIIEVMPFSSSVAKKFSKTYPRINVSARNFPLRAPELATKLRVREGGELQVFGATVTLSSRMLIVTRHIL